MSSVDIKKFTSEELTQEMLDNLIEERSSFEVVAIKDVGHTVNFIEGRIERVNLSCRIYSEFRTAAIAATAIPTPITVFGGLLAAASTAVHNIATYNPDYEIGKNYAMKTLMVKYQRDR